MKQSRVNIALNMKGKKSSFFFFLRGKKLNSVLYIGCFKYLLCNYSSNRERETDLLSLKFTICLYKTCVRCSISEMKNDTHQEKRYRITDRFTIQSKIEVIEKRDSLIIIRNVESSGAARCLRVLSPTTVIELGSIRRIIGSQFIVPYVKQK